MKKFLSLLILLLVCCSFAFASVNYRDGEYEAFAKGFGGDVCVQLTIHNGRLKAISVSGQKESPIGNTALQQLGEKILEANGVDGVDTIAGATITSKAILEAATECLRLALTGETPAPTATPSPTPAPTPTPPPVVAHPEYRDGIYNGQASSFSGMISVKMALVDGWIVYITVDAPNETSIGNKAVQELPDRILAANGVDGVDTITGATITSKAILEAATECLRLAQNGTTSSPTTVPSPTPTPGVSHPEFPEGLYKIKDEAFFGAKNIVEVALPEGVETIGARAFAESGVKLITLPESLHLIDATAFSGCAGLKAIVKNGSYAHSWCVENNIEVIFQEEDIPDDPDLIPDEMISSDGKYEIAFISSRGNTYSSAAIDEATWEGVKQYAVQNGKSYKYYTSSHGEATDEERYAAMVEAVKAGAEVIVCSEFWQGTALAEAAAQYRDVHFLWVNGWLLGLENVAPISFAVEQGGYLAGYATVMEGFEQAGFAGGGGGTNPECCQYGYGFAQGMDAAAQKLNKKPVLKYTWQYGASFSPSPELQTMMSGWYECGTEIIFVCGGSMFDSVNLASLAYDAYVIGVDVDQSLQSETVRTSPIKNFAAAAKWGLSKHYGGEWSQISNQTNRLGAAENAIGLPVDTWKMKNFSIADYESVLAALRNGTLTVDDSIMAEDEIWRNTNFTNLMLIYE